MNIYEIRLNEDLLKDISTINVFLFQCQCALFLVDITSKNSFELIKNLINNIDFNNFPYLKIIVVETKTDLINQKEIDSNEIHEFLNSNKSIEHLKISLKTSDNLNDLLNKIDISVNEAKNDLPCNLILESTEKITSLINYAGSLTFILIGNSTVGKSCFYKRYFKNEFEEGTIQTIGVDKETKHIKINEKSYKITLWDTAGQEKFRFLPKRYYNNAEGVFLLFDVTNSASFDDVSKWMNDIKQNSNVAPLPDGQKKDVTIYLIGNKIDLDNREITKEQAENEAKSLGLKYFEVSCKTNMNISEVINSMILDCYLKANKDEEGFKLKKQKSKGIKKKGCC